MKGAGETGPGTAQPQIKLNKTDESVLLSNLQKETDTESCTTMTEVETKMENT